jgi:hypothetical protein
MIKTTDFQSIATELMPVNTWQEVEQEDIRVFMPGEYVAHLVALDVMHAKNSIEELGTMRTTFVAGFRIVLIHGQFFVECVAQTSVAIGLLLLQVKHTRRFLFLEIQEMRFRIYERQGSLGDLAYYSARRIQ